MRGIGTPSRRQTLQVVGDPFLILSSDDAVIQVRSRTMLGGQEYHIVIVTSGLFAYVVGHVQLHTSVSLL
jgi:hypothetical protein